MKKVFSKSDYTIETISKRIILSLVPLIVAGYYKNGVKLYLGNYTGLYGMFKPLLITILGFSLGVIINILYETVFRRSKDSIKNKVFSSFHPVYGILIASIVSINTNIILFITITFIFLFASKFIKTSKINIMALTALIIILIINLTSEFSFLNIYEASKTLSLEGMDYLIGKGSGGINTSYVILLLISLIILAKEEYYKKSIPLISGTVYGTLVIIYSIITNNINNIFEHIFSNGILFCFIYIATDSLSSSYTLKGKYIFGILVGSITFILYFIEPSLAALGAILISSLLHEFIDNINLK